MEKKVCWTISVRNLSEIVKIVLGKFDIAGERYFDYLLFRHVFTKYTNNAEDVDIIYETRGRVFHHISKHREVCWKNEAQPSFLAHFEVFGYMMKHSSECFILHVKQMRILGESWEESWVNLCKFLVTYPNSVSVSIFFVFILWIINEF